MKVCVIQPEYCFDKNDLSDRFMSQIALLDKCTADLDIIVLPEYTDVPVATGSGEAFHSAIKENNKIIVEKARETAKRCSSIVFVNAASESELGYRNTTYAIDREGNIVGKYFKAHPAPSEVKRFEEGGNGLDVEYSYSFDKPYTITIEGIRFAFMTCYDFYFYENFARVAREKVDIIIGCSHQRTDSHEALSIINRFLCYNTNAHLIRASVSLGEDSDICGCSCVINPKGEEIVNMKSRVGLAVCEIDPFDKYYKPAGYKGALKAMCEQLLIYVFRQMHEDVSTRELLKNLNKISPTLLKDIQEDCAGEISMAEYARKCCYTPAYFSRHFKQCSGCTFTEYVQKARIEKAKRLIIETERNIDEIAWSVGYRDRKQFYTVFTKHCGKTPGAFRKKHT